MFFRNEVPEIQASEVPDEGYLLDVREQDEWDAGHARGAVHIPMGALNARAAEIPNDRDIYVICRSGVRSAQVTDALNRSGRTARNVAGGMHAWAAANRPMGAATTETPHVI